jgi:hypothetical protein
LTANAGQPLCADEDGLAAILLAGVMKDTNPAMADKLLKSATGYHFCPQARSWKCSKDIRAEAHL